MTPEAKAQLIGKMSSHLVQTQVKLVKAEARIRELEMLNRDLAKVVGRLVTEVAIYRLSFVCPN